MTGAARAAQTKHSTARRSSTTRLVAVPVLLHGDAAFPAQGVVAETLNLQSLAGYATGGTIHIIQNNQIGFTTEPQEARSTPYAADMAKGFNVPIVHVNADDPEACVAAIRLAMAYRERWGRDVVIDLIGYRRFGHNETDEPAYTQPLMAAKIKEHPPVSELYAESLVKEGIVTREEVETRKEERQQAPEADSRGAALEDRGRRVRGPDRDRHRRARPHPQPQGRDRRRRGAAIRKLNEELLRVPDSFTIHRKLRKPLEKRIEALDERRHRVRPRRVARPRLAADRGRPHPLHRPGHRARHLLATATWSCTTRRPACATRRSRTCPTPRRRWSSTTARSRRPRASASSTATRRPRPTAWCSGRRSSATSATPPR